MFLKTNCRKFLSCHAYICGFKVLFDCKFLCEPICASLLLRWGATRLERSCAFTMYRSASYCIQLGQDRTVSKLMRATHLLTEGESKSEKPRVSANYILYSWARSNAIMCSLPIFVCPSLTSRTGWDQLKPFETICKPAENKSLEYKYG